jgi:hypothetical protein
VRTVSRPAEERGEIRLGFLFDMALVAVIAYAAFQIGPAVLLRIKFVDEMTVAANSPVEVDAPTIKRNLLHTAESYGVILVGQDLLVIRNRELKRTVISATYEIHIHFWPSFTYVWLVKDDVQGYYF